jgi:hypothetical protein
MFKENIVYITRDIERALALDLNNSNYYIISNNSLFAKPYKNKNILLIDEKRQLDTWEFFENQEVINFINKIENPNIVVFKNTKQIERICKKNNWNLVNPSAELANEIEEKLSQIKFLDELSYLLPKFEVKLCKDIFWKKEKFILQFNRAHTGTGTFFIQNKKELDEITKKFPHREAKISKFIDGPVFTSNNIISKNKILIGNISYQITGFKKFTNNKFSTIGNDWHITKKILSEKQINEYKEITTKVAEKMKKYAWLGLFGVDMILDQKTGKLYLLEINARQPASTTYESVLQKFYQKNSREITTFEAHILALLKKDIESNLININNGAQILKRILKENQNKIDYKKLDKLKNKYDLNIITYDNNKLNSELIRFQTKENFIKKHKKLNKIGKKIKKI